ncbi:substrate-binding domain-containing protein [Aquibacillus koreensis]|uniref:Substrate-binding domain-containing protein n=1 Tax=Aquibacillus koreensis TaxID=279446 RepID=A0A9X3WLN4_9BACI|nr:substrate-binding domain-containing protein [Aquibacillus koreensis]MCT2538168.1 substrate-binding domain-containing protein [Aquibacillus koreensis]MDC3420888.1 substrate-binding domain-containing protein [Aquibacillus koreensis]
MDHFESWKQGYIQKVVIATAPQIASSFLPSLLRDFMDQHPDIEVIINVIKSFDIGEEVGSGKADIGLSRIHPVQSNVNTVIVHEEPVILVSPYQGQDTSHTSEKDILTKYRLITHNHPDYWGGLLHDIKQNYPTLRTMEVNQVEVTKKFIENGLGVSYLPYSMVKDELSTDRLSEIKPDKIALPKSATYVLSKVETKETASFIAFLKRYFVFQENISEE